MMTFSKILLMGGLTLLFVGCSNTPENAVRNTYGAIKEGDLSKLMINTTDSMSAKFALGSLKNCSVNKKSYTSDLELVHDCLVEEYGNVNLKDLKITMLSEKLADANITVESDSKEKNYQLKVIKIEDKWKVAFITE